MTYIGIDLGNKRVGIATSFNGICMPYKTVERVKIVGEIKKIINEKKDVKAIVVGLPYDLYGMDNRQLDRTTKFIDKLKNIFPDISIYGEDERFTSLGADLVMKEKKTKDKTGERDNIAASLILETFLNKI